MSNEPRFVFDTNAIVSALLFERSVPAQAFFAVLGQHEILVSAETVAELTEVLGRRKFDRYLTLEEREQFLIRLLIETILVEVHEELLVCRDAKDNKFLELAVAGGATCVISGDDDLLCLHPFRGIAIVTPAEFLATSGSRLTDG